MWTALGARAYGRVFAPLPIHAAAHPLWSGLDKDPEADHIHVSFFQSAQRLVVTALV
jgi:hypothetical protein